MEKGGKSDEVAIAECVFIHHKLTLLHSEQPKLYRVLVILTAIGLRKSVYEQFNLGNANFLF